MFLLFWGRCALAAEPQPPPVAPLHTLIACLMPASQIVHLYPALSTSALPSGNLKETITGYEETSEEAAA